MYVCLSCAVAAHTHVCVSVCVRCAADESAVMCELSVRDASYRTPFAQAAAGTAHYSDALWQTDLHAPFAADSVRAFSLHSRA